jgi:hypothetical protein
VTISTDFATHSLFTFFLDLDAWSHAFSRHTDAGKLSIAVQ